MNRVLAYALHDRITGRYYSHRWKDRPQYTNNLGLAHFYVDRDNVEVTLNREAASQGQNCPRRDLHIVEVKVEVIPQLGDYR